MKFIFLLVLSLFQLSSFGESCGKISELSTYIDPLNGHVQSVVIITKSEILTIKDKRVITAVEATLIEDIGRAGLVHYIEKHDPFDYLSELGYEICTDQKYIVSRKIPFHIVDELDEFNIVHNGEIVLRYFER